ncbi:MAG: polymerase subunit alpha, partial [Patescibacteria group bacterium]|nr:polymerase subunit alpha [Patescibacteria group bacterium]
MSFVHLHCHTHYSLLKAVPQISDLIAEVKRQGMTAVALTDNGALYGAIEFYEKCLKAGIKPIIGCELYMVPDRADQSFDQPKPYHLTVIAEYYEGYKNLMKLVSRAALEGFYEGLPRADKTLLRELGAGLIVLSGCKQGEISQLILSGDKVKAQKVAEEFREMLGDENFYLELQDHPDLDGQFLINEGLQEIGKLTGIPLVVTRDVHYLVPDDAEAC